MTRGFLILTLACAVALTAGAWAQEPLPAPADRDAPADSESTATEREGTMERSGSPVADRSGDHPKNFKDDVEVISADPAGKQLTVKLEGEEKTFRVSSAPSAKTLKVVRPGDTVRLIFDEGGAQSNSVKAFVIMKPNYDADQGSLKPQGQADKGSQNPNEPQSQNESQNPNEEAGQGSEEGRRSR